MCAMQYAVLPFRRGEGGLEVMMVTSRDTARWVVPKGWPMQGLAAPFAAAREAYEEAGIRGEVGAVAIGGYTYWKILPHERRLLCTVEVFPFRVREELPDWPERRQRRRAWFTPVEAAEFVEEQGLGALITRCAAGMSLADIVPPPPDKPRKKARGKKAPPTKTRQAGPKAKAKAKPRRKPAKSAPAPMRKKR